jgi:hypothetical protein
MKKLRSQTLRINLKQALLQTLLPLCSRGKNPITPAGSTLAFSYMRMFLKTKNKTKENKKDTKRNYQLFN